MSIGRTSLSLALSVSLAACGGGGSSGGGTFGNDVVATDVNADGATCVLLQVSALAGALTAGEIIGFIDEESADRQRRAYSPGCRKVH